VRLNLTQSALSATFFSLNIFLFEMTLSWEMMEDEANILSRYLHLKKQSFDCFKTTHIFLRRPFPLNQFQNVLRRPVPVEK